MDQVFLSRENLSILVNKLSGPAKVYGPMIEFDQPHLNLITPDNSSKLELNGFRMVESFKSLFFKVSQSVSDAPASPSYVLLGARACDIESLDVLDKVFSQGDFDDIFYTQNRKNTLIISADCTDAADTCFCNLVGGKPYPAKGFDLNLTPISNGFAVEIGSDKGQRVVDENNLLFSSGNTQEKQVIRQRVMEKLENNNAGFKTKLALNELHRINLENKHWKKLTKDCVECSNCNFVCPTCSCFLLSDARRSTIDYRQKTWDACLKNGYARVAGGANSRPKLFARLQNRYQCKFDYSYSRIDRYTCVGCGRCCVKGCAARIDMRAIFVELEKQVPLTAKLK